MNTPCSGPHFLKHGEDSRAAWKELGRTGQAGQPKLPATMGTWCFWALRGSIGNPPTERCPGAHPHSPFPSRILTSHFGSIEWPRGSQLRARQICRQSRGGPPYVRHCHIPDHQDNCPEPFQGPAFGEKLLRNPISF